MSNPAATQITVAMGNKAGKEAAGEIGESEAGHLGIEDLNLKTFDFEKGGWRVDVCVRCASGAASSMRGAGLCVRCVLVWLQDRVCYSTRA